MKRRILNFAAAILLLVVPVYASQTWTDNTYQSDHTAATDLQAIENNFAALKTNFSGTSAPSGPSGLMWWADTANNLLKLRDEANNAWLEIYDFGNDRVGAGKVGTASIAAGALSADTTGRAKMADLFITNAKVNDVDGSKLATNSVAGDRVQNNAITPSKIVAGGGTLVTWSGGGSSLALNAEGNLASGMTNYGTDGTSYLAFWKGYMYIPSGAKYVILGVRGQSVGANAYVRVLVGSTGGSVATLTGGSGFVNAAGSSLDISGEAGGWKLVQLQVVGASGSTSQIDIVGATVQWYGA